MEELEFLVSLDDTLDVINTKLDHILGHVIKEEKLMSTGSDALLNAFGNLNSAVDDLVTAETSGATEIAQLAEQIKNLQPNTQLTVDQITSLAAQATSAAQALNTAVDTAQSGLTTPPDPNPEPAPEPTPSPEPTPAPPAPEPAPDPTPAPAPDQPQP